MSSARSSFVCRPGLNINCLTNKHYFATSGSNGYVASDPSGCNQALQAGAPWQWLFNINAKF